MTTLRLDTRRGNQIDNFQNRDAPIYGDRLQAQAWRERFLAANHRPTPVCFTYNCHGLTFASRRTEVNSPQEVRRILSEDDYERVSNLNDVLPGDIAIYITPDNDIEHSGIVVEVPRFAEQMVTVPKILSKWGSAHEVIHPVNYSPYAGRVEYYRVTA